MKKIVIIALVLVLIIGAGAYFYLSGTSNSTPNNENNMVNENNNLNTNNNTQTNIQNNTETPTTNTPPASTPQTYNIEIKDFAFSPKELTIKKGDTIIWTNKDNVGHTATADNEKFNSRMLNKDENYSFTFYESDEFSYYCSPHPYMKAKIIVE